MFLREWDGLCQERPGVPQGGAAEGFLCRKAGDGWDLGVYRSRFYLDLTVLYVCQSNTESVWEFYEYAGTLNEK